MGNRPRKISRGVPSQGNPRAENDGDPVSPSAASKSSSSKVPVPVQVHCTEVFIVHISPKENEVYILVPPEEMEDGRPQEDFEKSSEMSSIAMASGISEEEDAAPELANSTTETSVKMDVQPSGEDLLCEACQLLLPETPPTPPPKTYKTSSSAERTSDSSAVSEEEAAAELASIGTLPVGVAEPREGTKDLRPSSELSKGTEEPGWDQKVSCETDPELTTNNVPGAAEEQATGQSGLDEAGPEEALRKTAEPHPNLVLAETPDRPSSIDMAAPGDEQLAKGQADPQDHRPRSVSEMEGKIPEECSAVGSWKEREDHRSPQEVSTEAELQPNDPKVPCGMCLELTTESTEGAAEEPTTVQGQPDEDASTEKPVDIESHLDLALVETSGGTSGMDTAPGTQQIAEEQSIPGPDLPVAATKMEGQVSGEGSGTENTGEIPKAQSSQLKKTPPTEARDKTLAHVEAGHEAACPIAPNTPLEKELEPTLTAQRLSTAEGRPNSDVQLCGDAEFLDAAQVGEAGPAVGAAVAEASPAVGAMVAEALPALGAAVPEALPALEAAVPEALPALEAAVPEALPALEAAVPEALPALEAAVPEALPALEAAVPEASPALEAAVPEASSALEGMVPEASPALEVVAPEAHTAVHAQPPAEATVAQTSPKVLLGAAEAVKELGEASPDQPLAEETIEQAGSPEAQLPPAPGTPLRVEREEEDAEFVDAADTCKAAEVPAGDGVLVAQEEHSGKDEAMQESPVGSPKLVPEEARGETFVHSDADFSRNEQGGGL